MSSSCSNVVEEPSRARARSAAATTCSPFRCAERIFRVLEYVIPVATAVEFAHLVRHLPRTSSRQHLSSCRSEPAAIADEIKLADSTSARSRPDLDVSMTPFQPSPHLYSRARTGDQHLRAAGQLHPGLARSVLRDSTSDITENTRSACSTQRDVLDRSANRTQEAVAHRPFAEPARSTRRASRASAGRPHLLRRRVSII